MLKRSQRKERDPYSLTWGDRWYRFKNEMAIQFNKQALILIGIIGGVFFGALMFFDSALGFSPDGSVFSAFGMTMLAMYFIYRVIKSHRRGHYRSFQMGAHHAEEQQRRQRLHQEAKAKADGEGWKDPKGDSGWKGGKRPPAKGSLDNYDVELKPPTDPPEGT